MSISLADFNKFYPLRAQGIAWFFGAGSSVSAGVPSAYDFIWDFKRRIYCVEQSYPISLFRNLTDQGIREQIQNYFDSQIECPELNHPDEYSYYFERAYKSEQDRSAYIAQQTSGMQLSYGHKVIGMLMKYQFINLIFTTNFDKGFENVASTNLTKLESWFCTDLSNGDEGIKVFQAQKIPLIVKLHGDFFSNKLKNTTSELQLQDEKLQHILSSSLDSKGLCVMGYSGRDQSILTILRNAIEKVNSFPNGLFWFKREGSVPSKEIIDLIEYAKSKGKQAEFVDIITFDTAWADIVKGFDNILPQDLQKLNENYHRTTNSPMPSKGRKYPLIRINAIPILKYPATARLFKCEAGNTREIKQLIENSKSPLLAIRKQTGIVGFGNDEEFERVFGNSSLCEHDIFQITERDLMYDDSVLRGLLTSAVLQALANTAPFRTSKRRDKNILFPNPKNLNDSIFSPLKAIHPNISGKIPDTTLTWVIALEIQIKYILQQPLLVLSPTVIVSKVLNQNDGKKIAPFIKEFTALWYNKKYDEALNSWISVLFSDKREIVVSAFEDNIKGINATFKLSRTTTYTKTT